MTVGDFFQYLVNGISLGSLFALIAVGYTMVYGILRLINFAHGDIFMMSIYFSFFAVIKGGAPLLVGFLMAIIATALLGALIEVMAYKPLREAPRITVMISAIGISFFLQNLATLLFSGRPQTFPQPGTLTDTIIVGGLYIQKLSFFIPVTAIVLMFILLYLVDHTKVGMAMRASSKDIETARIMGVNVNRTITITFGIGSVLAAVGGAMWGLKYPSITPMIGVIPGLKCFIAAVLGGIGNIKGAVIGGFILGITEVMAIAFFQNLSGYRDAFAFVVLILLLLFRPTGIMGEKIAEKV